MLFVTTAQALETKTLNDDRKYEPFVSSEAQLQLDNFVGYPVDRFTAYRYTAATGTWSLIPVQVDQKHYTDFGQQITCTDGKPACACGPTNTCHLCEMSYVWDGQNDPDDTGGTANVLDSNDEIAFMAKDTGDQAPTDAFPDGTSGIPRYEIKIGNAHSGYGFVYLYRYPSTAPQASPYVEISTSGSGATQQTTFRVCDHPLLAGFDGYEAVLKGNWSLIGLKVQAAGTVAACGVDYSSDLDVLDRLKWRMGAETDETWNSTSTYLGLRNGPVRSVRGSIGAASGYGTTHYFFAYPTYWKDDVDLRVHGLLNPIQGYIDWMSAAANLNGPVCPQSNFSAFRGTIPGAAFDYVDGGCAPMVTGVAAEPRQFNGPYISWAEVFVEDPQHPIPADLKALYYLDDRTSVDGQAGLEDEPGAFGDMGVQFGAVNSTEERDCTATHFAHLSRIWQLKLADSGVSRAKTLDDNEKKYAFEATTNFQCPGCGGGPGPGPAQVCPPTVVGTNTGTGFNSHLSLSSSCGTAGLWFRLYRATGAAGQFALLASLGNNLSFMDYQVERGQTYRYYAESYNSAGQTSAPSSTVSVTVTDTIPPTPPLISGGISGTTATLAWDLTDDFDLAGFNLYRSEQSGGPYTRVNVAGAVRATSYSVQALETGVTYYFIVKAVDQGGNESVPSNEIALTAQ